MKIHVFRVQDHHGHAPQVHSGEKERHLQKINVGDDGRGNTLEPEIMPGQRTQKIIVLPKTEQGPVSKREIL